MWLVTGAGSGLGRYCHQRAGGLGLTRNNWDEMLAGVRAQGVGVIMHCAFNSRRDITTDNLVGYLEDTFLLTQTLVDLPHEKFVFVSSIDVYPTGMKTREASAAIPLDGGQSLYGRMKLMCEALVRDRCQDPLILRASMLLGVDARPSNLIRLLREPHPRLSLTPDSRVNCVTHEDVWDFTVEAVDRGLGGVYNLAAGDTIALEEVAKRLGQTPEWGAARYDAGDVVRARVTELCPRLESSSWEVIQRFKETSGW